MWFGSKIRLRRIWYSMYVRRRIVPTHVISTYPWICRRYTSALARNLSYVHWLVLFKPSYHLNLKRKKKSAYTYASAYLALDESPLRRGKKITHNLIARGEKLLPKLAWAARYRRLQRDNCQAPKKQVWLGHKYQNLRKWNSENGSSSDKPGGAPSDWIQGLALQLLFF